MRDRHENRPGRRYSTRRTPWRSRVADAAVSRRTVRGWVQAQVRHPGNQGQDQPPHPTAETETFLNRHAPASVSTGRSSAFWTAGATGFAHHGWPRCGSYEGCSAGVGLEMWLRHSLTAAHKVPG